jgi:hypothetical protein
MPAVVRVCSSLSIEACMQVPSVSSPFRHAAGSITMVALYAFGGAYQLPAQGTGLESNDLTRLRAVAQVAVSPDGGKVAYAVTMRDRPGRPYTQIWILTVATQQSYPREGHGLAETKHIIDETDRKLAWYDSHFAQVRPGTITNVQP